MGEIGVEVQSIQVVASPRYALRGDAFAAGDAKGEARGVGGSVVEPAVIRSMARMLESSQSMETTAIFFSIASLFAISLFKLTYL
jgi:hypothetical protein